jgi:hypothetical protein
MGFQHSMLSLNAFRGWRNRSTGNILTGDLGVPSFQSQDHELGPSSFPRTSGESSGLAALFQSSSTQPSPLLHVPETRHAPIRQPSTRSLSAVTDGSFQKQRSGSSPLEALLHDNRVPRLNVEEEIKAEISKQPQSTKDPDLVESAAVPALIKVQNSDEPKTDVPLPSITESAATPTTHSQPQVQFAPLNVHAANKSVTSSPPSTPKSLGSPPPAQAAPQVKSAVPGPGYLPERTSTPIKSLMTVVPPPPVTIKESTPVPLPESNKVTTPTPLSSPIPVIPVPASLNDQNVPSAPSPHQLSHPSPLRPKSQGKIPLHIPYHRPSLLNLSQENAHLVPEEYSAQTAHLHYTFSHLLGFPKLSNSSQRKQNPLAMLRLLHQHQPFPPLQSEASADGYKT